MMKFRCSVCSYIHIGDNPPERCPVCGASHDKFVLIEKITKEIEKIKQDLYCDLVIVGSGAAALSAACFAKAKGLDVIIVEKAEEFGGTTKRSGGRYWIPNNKQQKELGIIDDKEVCLKYMVRLSYPEQYNEQADNYGLDNNTYLLFEAYYENAHKAVEKLAEIGVMESAMDYCWREIPFCDYQDVIQQPLIRGRTILPFSDKGHLTFGTDLIDFLLKYLNKEKVKMYSNFRVINLLRDGQKALGIIGRYNNQYVNVHASQGVFFGTGGFSHNLDMMNKFQPGNNYGGCAVPSNEGDIVNIALKNSLGLANMQNAYHVQSMLEVYLANPDGASSMFYHIGDSTIQVNKYGKRFMNEKRNYNDRTRYHYDWDANNADWPNRLSFMIFDNRMATLWQGFPPLPVGDPKQSFYIISGETLGELADNIKERLENLQDKVPNFKLDPDFKENLKETIKTFNSYAIIGKDVEFNRGDYVYDQEFTTFPPTIPGIKWPDDKYPNLTMYPFSDEGPYYAIILAAGTLDTNGGVIVNEKAQVMDAYNKVIENLYAGGNCVAAFNKAGYYGAGGTIGPAFTNAYLAIENITKKKEE